MKTVSKKKLKLELEWLIAMMIDLKSVRRLKKAQEHVNHIKLVRNQLITAIQCIAPFCEEDREINRICQMMQTKVQSVTFIIDDYENFIKKTQDEINGK
jgi:hypothetical protein